MNPLLTIVFCVGLLAGGSLAAKICRPPYGPGYEGADQECAALLQAKCPVGHTTTWVRGIRVKGNCGGTIAPNTAIATFEGPGNTYNTPNNARQHAAIFVSCDATNGITVYDQWGGSGGTKQRVLRYGNTVGNGVSNNGDSFYVIQ